MQLWLEDALKVVCLVTKMRVISASPQKRGLVVAQSSKQLVDFVTFKHGVGNIQQEILSALREHIDRKTASTSWSGWRRRRRRPYFAYCMRKERRTDGASCFEVPLPASNCERYIASGAGGGVSKEGTETGGYVFHQMKVCPYWHKLYRPPES